MLLLLLIVLFQLLNTIHCQPGVIAAVLQTTAQPTTTSTTTNTDNVPSIGYINDSQFYQIRVAPMYGEDYYTPVNEQYTTTNQQAATGLNTQIFNNNPNINNNDTVDAPVYHNTATFIDFKKLYNCTVERQVALFYHQHVTQCGTHCIQFNLHTMPQLNSTDTATLYTRCNGATVQQTQLQSNTGDGVLTAQLKRNQYCKVNTWDYVELFYVFKNHKFASCQSPYYAYQIPQTS